MSHLVPQYPCTLRKYIAHHELENVIILIIIDMIIIIIILVTDVVIITEEVSVCLQALLHRLARLLVLFKTFCQMQGFCTVVPLAPQSQTTWATCTDLVRLVLTT